TADGPGTAEAPATADALATAEAPAARPPRRRRAPRPDPLLVEARTTAREAVAGIADDDQVGEGHGVRVEEDRLVTHLFECTLPGYRGWNWYATLARAPRSRTVTVCELGLLPGRDALLAPEWVPWSERVSPEEKAQAAQEDDAGDELDGATAEPPAGPADPAAETAAASATDEPDAGPPPAPQGTAGADAHPPAGEPS
ncbi:DUF3027 domain-containing protein, partial [Kocuria flava]|uniref:DUF3027 domain-containing protein n=1 Tax=Kocuria flava TaxID=446860 RepID=UPI003F1A6249